MSSKLDLDVSLLKIYRTRDGQMYGAGFLTLRKGMDGNDRSLLGLRWGCCAVEVSVLWLNIY